MHRFEIWAPRAKKLAVRVNSATLPMYGPDERGWWRLDIPEATAGSDYGYQIDDDSKLYPDPRSLSQPNGVHGLSRVYDQQAFVWGDANFSAPPLASGVIYELHIGTFTPEGTLDSAISKLDYLVDLGVTHVELMPVASFAGDRGWGYDGVALFAVHEAYGGPDALKRFVDAAHGKGLSLLLDVVYNHFGPVGNYTGKFGPYLVEAHQTPWGGAVNFEDSGADQVRRFFCDNALMWMRDFHIDGLRLDAVHGFVDRSAIHFLEQLSIEVEALETTLARRLVLIAESDLNDPRVITPREANGLGMDAQWNDDFHHALFAALNPEEADGYYADFGELSQLAKTLERNFVYDGIYSKFRDRVHGRPAGNLSQHRFVGFIQNHDQVGNRAIGDRLQEVVGFDRAKIAAALVLLGPFVPLLFQGEEWAASSPFQYFADHDDPEMARLVSEGRKREFASFGWEPSLIPDPEKRETFERSKLKWDEVNNGQHEEMLTWYRELIRLRRTTPSLNHGEPGHTHISHNQSEDQREMWLSMSRGEVTVQCNLGNDRQLIAMPKGKRLILSSHKDVTVTDGEMTLPANSVAIFL
ncbi:malto-oligosyltrehalose trehalohydrolase [Acidicapsa ligni]|uniref:malto-oligosyltrehalose trehalohydrolase n=1 Tax=Acidicapsa ligni TaxID=542300 RepID=UPI0021DFCA13|nr:malto-oligosyltrehalose trehalohydrolase [Acidicapsa ligni]